MGKGNRTKAEARKFDGERALKSTIQLTDNGGNNRHMGLACPTFSAQGTKLIYISDRDGSMNFYLMDLRTFESTQLTEGKGIFAGGSWFCAATREIFYWDRNAVKAVEVETLDERTIYEKGYQGGQLSVSCDGKLVAFSAKCDHIPGFSEEFRGRTALMTVSARGEGVHPILTSSLPLGRVQFSPVDPDLIVYSWEGSGSAVAQSAWYTDTSGVAGGPLGAQNPNEIRMDEFFTSSGERVGYRGSRYHIRNADGHYIVEETGWVFGLLKTGEPGESQFECPGPTGQIQMNCAENLLVCSAGGAMNNSGQAVSLLRPVGRSSAVFDPLFYHGAGARIQWVAPQFRPGDEEVVFTSDFSGCANIYLTSVK